VPFGEFLLRGEDDFDPSCSATTTTTTATTNATAFIQRLGRGRGEEGELAHPAPDEGEGLDHRLHRLVRKFLKEARGGGRGRGVTVGGERCGARWVGGVGCLRTKGTHLPSQAVAPAEVAPPGQLHLPSSPEFRIQLPGVSEVPPCRLLGKTSAADSDGRWRAAEAFPGAEVDVVDQEREPRDPLQC